MPAMLTFTPNPALDVATTVAQLLESHKMRCEAPQLHPGGGGINVARVLHRLGADVLALQEVDRNQPRSHGADLTGIDTDVGEGDHGDLLLLRGHDALEARVTRLDDTSGHADDCGQWALNFVVTRLGLTICLER